MTRRLENKVVIVTGAGTGIGEAIAHKFAKEGAKVIVNGLPSDPIEEVANAIRQSGGTAIAYAGDVTQEASAQGGNCDDRRCLST
ncbi:SDR family NAD(P)-dependent oxidoreductase [Phormidesmis priestleyi]|uniref:SDR family NAD(P)-dependent oxidoreductase n=1 Tax=Phormidesmis priestleyi TaxID=268141 RepID=UPI001C63894E|nr:SDR family NAD(P)-dependent oxidoreductase [Phormidesmis priestleyi]